jgi:hypothetical protein
MPCSEMLRRVALVRIDVLKETIVSIIRVTRIGKLGTLAVTGNRSIVQSISDGGSDTVFRNVGSYKNLRRSIPKDGNLHSHRCEILNLT